MQQANSKPRVIVEAVVTRADGTKEDLGVIASMDIKKESKLKKF